MLVSLKLRGARGSRGQARGIGPHRDGPGVPPPCRRPPPSGAPGGVIRRFRDGFRHFSGTFKNSIFFLENCLETCYNWKEKTQFPQNVEMLANVGIC